MPKYTISVCYHLAYFQDVVVEADSVEDACNLAIEQADSSPDWRPCDDPMPSHVDGIYIGETPTGCYWDKPNHAPDDPPIPAPFNELNAMYSRETIFSAIVSGEFHLADLTEVLEAARFDIEDEPLARRASALVKLLRDDPT